MTAEVINANPKLKGIGVMCSANPLVDMKAATARKLPVVVENREETFPGVAPTTADLTMAMLLSLAYRLPEADRLYEGRQVSPGADAGPDGPRLPGQDRGPDRASAKSQSIWRRAFVHSTCTRSIPSGTGLPPEREKELGVEWVANLDDLLKRSDLRLRCLRL